MSGRVRCGRVSGGLSVLDFVYARVLFVVLGCAAALAGARQFQDCVLFLGCAAALAAALFSAT